MTTKIARKMKIASQNQFYFFQPHRGDRLNKKNYCNEGKTEITFNLTF